MNLQMLGRLRTSVADLATVAVVLAAYISLFLSNERPGSLALATVLIGLGILYTLVATYGRAYWSESASVWVTVSYFTVLLLLGTAIFFLSRFRGAMWIVLLPIAGHSVALPRPWALVVCILVLLAFMGPISLVAPFSNVIEATITYIPALVFVVIFTELIEREGVARAQIERLADELRAANRKLGEYATQVEELATAKERNRLAREIHDSIGHYLTVINVQISAARAVLDTDRQRALDALDKAQSLSQEGLADIRRSVAALRAAPIEGRPLPEVVAALVNETRAAGILTELVVSGVPRPLPPQSELTLYRAAQEALTNVRKHAHASRADLTLDYADPSAVRLVVKDNGVGPKETPGGFGLLGLRERVQLVGGDLRVHAGAGQGFTLDVGVPG